MVDRARAYRGVVEVIGLLGVIGSLVFVGLEVHQNTIATKAANDMALANQYQNMDLAQASSPSLSHALIVAEAGDKTATPEDITQARGLYRAVMDTWSNAYRQHLNGTLDSKLWDSIVHEISSYRPNLPAGTVSEMIANRGRFVREIWADERYLYSSDFQQFVDETLGIKR